MPQRVRQGVEFKIADELAADGRLRDLRAEDCDIVGPAVVIPLDRTTINGCQWDTADGGIESILWELNPTRQKVIGAVGLINVQLINCRLHMIGFAGPPQAIAQFISASTV